MSHYLYLLARDDPIQPHVKIGFTGNLKKRTRALQIGCSVKLFILFAFNLPGRTLASQAERSLHDRLAPIRLNGEWYASPWHSLLRAAAAHVAALIRSVASVDDEHVDDAIEHAGVYEALALADEIEGPSRSVNPLFIVKALQAEV